MKPDRFPQLLDEVRQDGKVTMLCGALMNAYFRDGWTELQSWVDEHGFYLIPPNQPLDLDETVTIYRTAPTTHTRATPGTP